MTVRSTTCAQLLETLQSSRTPQKKIPWVKPLSRSQNTEKTRLQESEVRSFLLSQTILFKYICLYIFSCIHVGINIRILWDSIFCLSIGSGVLDFKRFCTAIVFFFIHLCSSFPGLVKPPLKRSRSAPDGGDDENQEQSQDQVVEGSSIDEEEKTDNTTLLRLLEEGEKVLCTANRLSTYCIGISALHVASTNQHPKQLP